MIRYRWLNGVVLGSFIGGISALSEEIAAVTHGQYSLSGEDWWRVFPYWIVPYGFVGGCIGAYSQDTQRPGWKVMAIGAGIGFAARFCFILQLPPMVALILMLVSAFGLFFLTEFVYRPLLWMFPLAVPAILWLQHVEYDSALEWRALVVFGLTSLLSIGWGLVWRHRRLQISLPTTFSLGIVVVIALHHRPPLPTPAPLAPLPDLVLVIIDTLRADHLGSYGYSRPTSPHLDAFAHQSLRYDQAQSAAPWTLPAVASLLTGLEPHQHGAGRTVESKKEQALPSEVSTVAEALHARGYRTMAIVTNGYLKRAFGLDQGFDLWDDALGLPRPVGIFEPTDALGWFLFPSRMYRPADKIAQRAQQLWLASGGGPRFLVVHFMDPHKPLIPPQRHLQVFGEYSLINAYDAEIRFVDEQLGELLPHFNGAYIFITADHGEDLGGRELAYPDDQWPEGTRHGHTMYQELLRVPLWVAGPQLQSNSIDRVVRSYDIAPTLLNLAGIPSPKLGEPLAEVQHLPPPETHIARSQNTRVGAEKSAVRFGSLKLISTPWKLELYDLSNDPGEIRNLIHTMNTEFLQNLLPPDVEESSPLSLDETTRRQLEALGYAQ